MFYNENIVKLRQQNNMTQEELAEKLGVSRQTIYKWETGATYPDVDKVIDIAKLFNVSIDVLMNDKIEENSFSKNQIIGKVKEFAYSIGIGVFLILLGVAILVFISSFNDEKINIMATGIMLIFIFIGVILIVMQSLKYGNFKKNFCPTIEFNRLEKDKANNRFVRDIVLGLICIFVGIVLVVFSEITNDENIIIYYSVAGLLFLIGIAVFFFIKGGIMHDLYTKSSEFLKPDEEKKSPRDQLKGIVMLSCTAIFLVWGLVFDGFKIAWIMFIIGAIICGIIELIKKAN